MADTHAFYHPSDLLPGDHVVIGDEQFRHLRALRLQSGQAVTLLNGQGVCAVAVLQATSRTSAVFQVTESSLAQPETAPYIAVASGILADRARTEWAVEKAVELGANEFIPMHTRRSEGHAHYARLERVAIAALKQSQRPFLPALHQPMTFSDVLRLLPSFDHTLLCHERADEHDAIRHHLGTPGMPARVLLLLGPEGGFDPEEVAMAVKAGAKRVWLGPVRLRAETALVAALAALRILNYGTEK